VCIFTPTARHVGKGTVYMKNGERKRVTVNVISQSESGMRKKAALADFNPEIGAVCSSKTLIPL
jgi:hypothetical protein